MNVCHEYYDPDSLKFNTICFSVQLGKSYLILTGNH